MTRINSNFDKMIEFEKERALEYWDASKIISDVDGHFAYEYPDSYENRMDYPEMQLRLQQAELQALQFMEDNP